MGTENVSVRVRVRPGGGARSPCVAVEGPQVAVVGEKRYTFDKVHDGGAGQAAIYDEAVAPLVRCVLEGYNAAVLAYGQTGSGKTYTMGCGSETLGGDRAGVVPRCLRDVFAAAGASDGAVRVFASYVEIYNEELRDLLAPGTPKEKLAIRDHGSRGVRVHGAREVECRAGKG